MKPIVVVIGTRAEAIKLIPLYLALKKESFPVVLCATFQHFEMLKQVCELFEVVPDFNLEVMKEDQDIFHVHEKVLNRTKEVYLKVKPSLVIVHGDTTTTLSAAMSAFYMHIPIAHIEAGLRTGNMSSPFPEEMNRKVVGQIATYHFAPTAFSTANILSEGVPRQNVFCTGNTIVDALNLIKEKIVSKKVLIDPKLKIKVEEAKKKKQKIVLLTAHRRESFGEGLLNVFKTMKQFVLDYPDVSIFYPSHPNPNVLKAVKNSKIKEEKKIYVTGPLLHTDLIYLLMNVDWVATDSGGIQEEAVSLGKHVLCLRDITERYEGVWEGSEILVGTDPKRIRDGMLKFYSHNINLKPSMVYGDGRACERIVSILKNKLNFESIFKIDDFAEKKNCSLQESI